MQAERRTDPDAPKEERGSALIITMLVLFILMSLAVVMIKNGTLQSQVTIESRYRAIATGECESGIALALRQIQIENGAGNAFDDFIGPRALVTRNGTTSVVITDDAANKVVRVVATFVSTRPVAWDNGQAKLFRYRVEAYLASEDHPAFFKPSTSATSTASPTRSTWVPATATRRPTRGTRPPSSTRTPASTRRPWASTSTATAT